MHELYATALAEDATVFDYDGVYDQMKASTQKQPVRVTGIVPHSEAASHSRSSHAPRLRLKLQPRPPRRPSTLASC